ncbi:MAG TPA: ferredoxin family protein [Dehalococcoidia bacterium]|nr:ferredoxin family protein [Dehalococcoidia bacterium]
MAMRSGSGMFIRIEVDEPVTSDNAAAKQLAGICPVDIYAVAPDGGVDVVEANVDECILCGLCLEVGPAGAVRVIKRYDNDALLARS